MPQIRVDNLVMPVTMAAAVLTAAAGLIWCAARVQSRVEWIADQLVQYRQDQADQERRLQDLERRWERVDVRLSQIADILQVRLSQKGPP